MAKQYDHDCEDCRFGVQQEGIDGDTQYITCVVRKKNRYPQDGEPMSCDCEWRDFMGAIDALAEMTGICSSCGGQGEFPPDAGMREHTTCNRCKGTGKPPAEASND